MSVTVELQAIVGGTVVPRDHTTGEFGFVRGDHCPDIPYLLAFASGGLGCNKPGVLCNGTDQSIITSPCLAN